MRLNLLSLAVVGLSLSSVTLADSTSNYRTAFLAQCTDGDSDPTSVQMCACSWAEWESGLASKTDVAAVNAAKLMANTQVDLYPSEMAAASEVMGDMGSITMKCADSVFGKMSFGGYTTDDSGSNTESQPEVNYPDAASIPEPVAIPEIPQQEATSKKRGLLGAVTGWAGRKAGLGDELSEIAADKADENEDSLRSKLNPFKRGKDKEEAAE